MIIAVYGSLRPGCYNYDRFRGYYGEKNIKHVGSHEIPGYALYALNDSYPGVVENPLATRLVIDLLEVSDEVHESIRDMEIGAGYEEKEIEVEGKKAVIYVYKNRVFEYDRVKDGDWLEKAKNLNKIKAFYE